MDPGHVLRFWVLIAHPGCTVVLVVQAQRGVAESGQGKLLVSAWPG